MIVLNIKQDIYKIQYKYKYKIKISNSSSINNTSLILKLNPFINIKYNSPSRY